MSACLKTLLLVFFLLGAAGCGQKGPLVAPAGADDDALEQIDDDPLLIDETDD